MTVPQRLAAIDQLWESLVTSGAEIPSPAWHEEVLNERRALIESGKAEYITLEEARKHFGLPPE